jgi:16S rRNA (guanine527-N7)-methyltransferase
MADAPSLDELSRVVPVSRETYAHLALLVVELRRWQTIKNLVGPGTLDEVWTRHVVDSLQLLALEPKRKAWLDLGSGAGFPGLVIGIAGRSSPGVHVDLVESNGRKCSFLRHAARLTGASVTIHEARLEASVPAFVGKVDVVTARALANLCQLVAWTAPLLKSGTVGLFPKGRDAEAELTEARESWRFDADVIPSRTDPDARIIRVRHLQER